MANKGSSFERDISKFLSKWLTGSEKPYQYWRTPGSGSLCTIHEENAGLSGDIRALTSDAKFLTNAFSIECKTGYPGTSFWQHFSDTKTFKIREFWEQSCRDAKKANKLPMVIYRKKGKKPLMGMSYGVLDQILGVKKTYPYNSIIMSFRSEYDLPSMFLCDFEEFFSYVGVEQMRDACEELWRVLNIYGKT
jgi:hypothetical protein